MATTLSRMSNSPIDYMSIGYLLWAHGRTTDAGTHVLRAGRAAARAVARLRDHEAGRGTVRRAGQAGHRHALHRARPAHRRGARPARQRGERGRAGPPHLRAHRERVCRPARGGRADGGGGGTSNRPGPGDEGKPADPEPEDHMSEGEHGGAGRLERRARRLLRAYPAAYRADRGEEIIGTLLEAVPPGREWPPSREAAALIAAGLHARRAANLRHGLGARPRHAA